MNTDKRACVILATLLADSGITDVVVSPGSRNAPLVVALKAESRLRLHIVVDERSAAFMALGMAQVSQIPVAMVCTSGSAVLNYAPALAEAYYRGLPLIAISADRPAEWIDQDDSQTIHQYEALEKIVKRSYDIPDVAMPDDEFDWFVNRTVNDAIAACRLGKPGPVHINVQLRAPLGRLTADLLPRQRLVDTISGSDHIRESDLVRLLDMARGKKILVVAGFMEPHHRLQLAFSRLLKAPAAAVMAETVSNLHLPEECYSIDLVLSTLSEQEKAALRPDIVITVGGALISRQIKEYLRAVRPERHWSVGRQHTTVDCFRVLTERIDTDPAFIIRKLANTLARDSDAPQYARQWHKARLAARASARKFIDVAPWCELKAFATLFPLIPRDANLITSNGTSIRYDQLLCPTPFHATFCNRGVSGIDGCTSSAVGSALSYPGPTFLITGDMSFTYDLSALAIREIPPRLRIIIINNAGGGIFRFVSSTRQLDCREEMFCAPHPVEIRHLASAFGFEYLSASDPDELAAAMDTLSAPLPRPAILEIFTPGLIGGDILTDFMNRQSL